VDNQLFFIITGPPDPKILAAAPKRSRPCFDDPEICTRHVQRPMLGWTTFEGGGWGLSEAAARHPVHHYPSMPMA